MAQAASRIEEIQRGYLAARDGEQPTVTTGGAPTGAVPAWVQPTGAHDAYPMGYTVTHSGVTWRSLTAANVWEPCGASVPAGLWEKVTASNAATSPADDVTGAGPDAPAWDGNAHAYKTGERVTYKGAVYRVVQAHTSQAGWTPDVVAALYARV